MMCALTFGSNSLSSFHRSPRAVWVWSEASNSPRLLRNPVNRVLEVNLQDFSRGVAFGALPRNGFCCPGKETLGQKYCRSWFERVSSRRQTPLKKRDLPFEKTFQETVNEQRIL